MYFDFVERGLPPLPAGFKPWDSLWIPLREGASAFAKAFRLRKYALADEPADKMPPLYKIRKANQPATKKQKKV